MSDSSVLQANYFELFGLPASFQVDRAILTERYHTLQRSVHPDNFANATERERRLALQQTAHINEAFHILKDPMARGRYLLQLRGLEFNEETETISDPAFLMTQIELREELGEIATRADALSTFMQRMEQQIQMTVVQLGKAFDEDNLPHARQYVQQLKFYNRLYEETIRLEEECF